LGYPFIVMQMLIYSAVMPAQADIP